MEFILTFGFVLALFWLAGRAIRHRSPEKIGARGERAIEGSLSRLSPIDYRVVNNLLFRSGTRTVQIDHVIVSRYGIFVIETKNYKGWILGHENSKYWTQCLYRSKYKFYNPIRQNNGHIQALSRKLNIVTSHFISIVVFLEQADIKVETSQNVIYRRELKNVIRRYRDQLLSDSQVEEIYGLICSMSINDEQAYQNHAVNICLSQEAQREKIRKGVCPKCGRQLLLRRGKYGKFYGCAGYPNCRFTHGY